ncbi:MAG: hypothetical protein ACYSU0_05750 [Planctomycetota bacterium]
MPYDPARPPRLPYVAALLCDACILAAAWTWMTYSYCWEVKPRHFWTTEDMSAHYEDMPDIMPRPSIQERMGLRLWPDDSYIGSYVRVRGHRLFGETSAFLCEADHPELAVRVNNGDEWVAPPPLVATGRAELWVPIPVVDIAASRFHGASIAGLVVGAMGVFVFSVALRHWLVERRRFREGAKGA